MWPRILNVLKLLEKKSLILLGPRQTGKSSLVKLVFPQATYINLAKSQIYREYVARPELLGQRFTRSNVPIIIDEAQRIPELFNEVQVMLDENPQLRVILTGSSARKLRRNHVNLLPGRVWNVRLFPLVSQELGEPAIERRICSGSLPGILGQEDFKKELLNYVGNYLEEEIRQEAVTRNIANFARFLEVAALANGELISYRNISNDAGIKESTVRQYFEILSDTLIAHIVPPFSHTKSRKAVATPKFYFFDWGVVNALLNRFSIDEKSDLFGRALEHLIYQELTAYLSYHDIREPLTFWRTHSQFEVDFLVGTTLAIEVKATTLAQKRDERGLVALAEDVLIKRKILVCQESHYRITENGVEIFPVKDFLHALWTNKLIN